jgi:hypothetical protein
MKIQLNEIKRMQQLAGLITESQLNENNFFGFSYKNKNKDVDTKKLMAMDEKEAFQIARKWMEKNNLDPNEIQSMKQLDQYEIEKYDEIKESQLNEVELKITDLGPDFEKTVKEIFGDTVVVKDIDVSYRPSTDTGGKPYLYMGAIIPQTKESTKGVLLSIGFFNKEGKGVVKYDNYSKDKEATAQEFETKLIPAFKKAAAIALGKIVKDPNQLNQSTVGFGYKYEEKDQADLNKYITELPNLTLQESIDSVVNEALRKFRKQK